MSHSFDASAYYGYLFEVNKQPTSILDALLRAIGIYISENIGDVEKKFLTPEKLAAFYKAVGGNYDSLFVNVPPTSISWIYASIGCEHLLLPTEDHFIPPSIPSLTTAGFVRWQSIEILLGPEEHVPFIQTSLRLFDLKHPDTNEPFPVDLPASAFPLVPDPEIERWHDICARQLRKWATAAEERHGNFRSNSNVKQGYTHAHSSPRPQREETYSDQTSPENRPRSAHRSPSHFRPVKSNSTPGYMSHQFRQSDDFAPTTGRSRRRSNPEDFRGQDPKDEPEVHEIVVEEEPKRRRRVRLEHIRRHPESRQARRRSRSSDSRSEEPFYSSRIKSGHSRWHSDHTRTSRSSSSNASSEEDDRFSAHDYTSRSKAASYPELHRFDSLKSTSAQAPSREKPRKKKYPDDLPTVSPPIYSNFTPTSRHRYKEKEQNSSDDDSRRRNFRIPIFHSENMPFGLGKKDEDWLRHHRNSDRAGEKSRWRDSDGTAVPMKESREKLFKSDRQKRSDAREDKNGVRTGDQGWDWDVRLPRRDTKLQSSYGDIGRGDRHNNLNLKRHGLSFRERDVDRRYVYHTNLGRRSPVRSVGGSLYRGG